MLLGEARRTTIAGDGATTSLDRVFFHAAAHAVNVYVFRKALSATNLILVVQCDFDRRF
jgi:hypothetical protein